MKVIFLVTFLLFFSSLFEARRKLPHYTINLALSPEERFTEINSDFKEYLLKFKEAIFSKMNSYVLSAIDAILWIRPIEDEMYREGQALAKVLGITDNEVQLMNLFYEFTTFSFVGPPVSEMCLGVVARTSNGTIYHGRNLDLDQKELIAPLLYDATFTINSTVVFKAQMTAGYSGVVSGYKPHKFGLSEATRNYDSVFGDLSGIFNILRGYTQPTWLMRKVLENAQSYEDAKALLSNTILTTPIYFIITGLDTGAIISRDSDKPAHIEELGGKRFIIQANTDTFYNSTKRDKDTRRIISENYLALIDSIEPESIFNAIDHDGVKVPKTFWQGVYSADLSYWNSSSPIDI